MNKTLKKILIIIAILLVVAAIVVGVVLYIHNSKYISKNAAIDIAIADSGVDQMEIIETEAEFEKTNYSAWYEVEIETHSSEFKYDIDAVSGEILNSRTKARD